MGRTWASSRRRRLTRRDVERMNLPRGFWEVRLARTPEGARDEAVKYLERHRYLDGDGLFIWGKLGVGKTGLAAALLMELRRRGHTGLFVESATLVDKLLSGAQFDLDTSWAERVREVEVLVVDDIGAEHHDVGGAVEKKLESVLRTRSQEHKVTIVTCNVAPLRLGPHKDGESQKRGIFRQKFVSLIKEQLWPLEVDGPSMREERTTAMAAGYE